MEEMSGGRGTKKRTQEMLGSALVSGWLNKWKRRNASAKSRSNNLQHFALKGRVFTFCGFYIHIL